VPDAADRSDPVGVLTLVIIELVNSLR